MRIDKGLKWKDRKYHPKKLPEGMKPDPCGPAIRRLRAAERRTG